METKNSYPVIIVVLLLIVAGLAMWSYRTISALKAASSTQNAPASSASAPEAASQPTAGTEVATVPSPAAPASQAPPVSRKIADALQFVDSKITEIEPGKIRVSLQFTNKSPRTINEIDYTFAFFEAGTNKVLLSLNLREPLIIPPGLVAESTLDWSRAAFKTPAEYDALNENLKKGTLKVSVTTQRAKLDDGSIAEG